MQSNPISAILRALVNIDYHEIPFLSEDQWSKFRDDPWRTFLRFDDQTQDKIAEVVFEHHMGSGHDEDHDDGEALPSANISIDLNASGEVTITLKADDGDDIVKFVLDDESARDLASELQRYAAEAFPQPAGTA